MSHGEVTISTFELFEMIPDAEAARLYLEERRWHASPACPLCGAYEHITARTGKRIGYYRCHDCVAASSPFVPARSSSVPTFRFTSGSTRCTCS